MEATHYFNPGGKQMGACGTCGYPRESERHHQSAPERARPLSEWHEELGPVVWWWFARDTHPQEASWIGTPLDDDWPGYHTHFTPHPPIPTF